VTWCCVSGRAVPDIRNHSSNNTQNNITQDTNIQQHYYENSGSCSIVCGHMLHDEVLHDVQQLMTMLVSKVSVRSAFLWDFYLHFRTNYRSHPQESRPLKKGWRGCPETSVTNQHPRLDKILKSADFIYTAKEACNYTVSVVEKCLANCVNVWPMNWHLPMSNVTR
jgi:hypothetical protein